VTTDHAKAGGARRWWALVAVSLATFMTYLDNNVVNVAIPTIQHDLHLSVSGLEWVVSSYLLTLAGLLLVGGRVADLYGRRRVFMIGLALFTLSSLAAGLAGSGGVLIASRAIQGVGAALLMPTTLAIIMAAFADFRERSMAIGIWAAISALALALGPLVGGLISQHIRWGWIFLINVPIGLITLLIAARGVGQRARLDLSADPRGVRAGRRDGRGLRRHRDAPPEPNGRPADVRQA
jgi:MFS family permease